MLDTFWEDHSSCFVGESNHVRRAEVHLRGLLDPFLGEAFHLELPPGATGGGCARDQGASRLVVARFGALNQSRPFLGSNIETSRIKTDTQVGDLSLTRFHSS